ncbi:XPG domain containing-domain-containing protein [Dactylonectria estremocensis]|uniref:XPG domain containing-domain-containing protein n=1 Tax=Dactylonectria estremocensis TaxID=1079267 RepID=A0A9P9JJF6_9HYPO|nr:XPG domain containing-domain-containing protein [Dactylonectria estremocensis]
MGIPHLITTLEPFAVHDHLENQSLVIDGPALAYHILYICNRNGVVLPSYQLLGDTAVAWLDELTGRGMSIEAIYFDGHLPLAKRPVRMERMTRNFHQLRLAHSADPRGRSRNYLSSPTDSYETSALFSPKPPPGRPFLPPTFHVPAVIDALKLSSRYQPRVRLVPGEADAYCAQHLLDSGGTVLTSDSDLLVHDLGSGSVVFLRDIYIDGDLRLSCARFSPNQICERLGLPPNKLCRFAYERKRDTHLSLAQILQECSKPVGDPSIYDEFRQEYLHHEIAPLPVSQMGTTLGIDCLDPRVSELVLQLSNTGKREDCQQHKIFLPIMIEDPTRGSSWEQSTSIRQLTYTILKWIIPAQSFAVQEYRRVNNAVQKGRQVPLMSKALARDFAQDLVVLMTGIQREIQLDNEMAWYIFCLSLDVRHCLEGDKQSHALQTLQKASPVNSGKVSWETIHFVAQLQAAYYSLRMLAQALSLVPAKEVLPELHRMLTSMPPLSAFPDVDSVIEFLLKTSELKTMKLISKFVPLPQADGNGSKQAASKKRKVSKDGAPVKPVVGRKTSAARNPFDVLSQDE